MPRPPFGPAKPKELFRKFVETAGHVTVTPRLRPDQDDGVSPTHHSYVWEPDSAVTKARLAAGAMPEMHVWAAIPERGEIIDMTIRYWPQQCLLHWPGNKPPTYFWGTAEELPEGVLYAPDIQAIALALHLLKGES